MHSHAAPRVEERDRHKRRLRSALLVSAAMLIVEVAGGFASRSLALLADAAHLFADAASLMLAYTAMSFAELVPNKRYTFGFYRAEILAAFVNAEVLLVITGALLYESYRRFHAPPEVRPWLVTGFAVAALSGNLASMALLHAGREHHLNLRAAYLEVWSDALGSLGVLIGGLVMSASGWFWVDALVSAAIALAVLPRTMSLLRQSAHILLEGTPGEVDLAELRSQLLAVPGVEELHDLHFWTLTSGLHSASVHIRAAVESPRGEVLRAVQKLLKENAGVDHATIQVEWGAETTCETTDHA